MWIRSLTTYLRSLKKFLKARLLLGFLEGFCRFRCNLQIKTKDTFLIVTWQTWRLTTSKQLSGTRIVMPPSPMISISTSMSVSKCPQTADFRLTEASHFTNSSEKRKSFLTPLLMYSAHPQRRDRHPSGHLYRKSKLDWKVVQSQLYLK